MKRFSFRNKVKSALIVALTAITPFMTIDTAQAGMLPTETVVAGAPGAREQIGSLIERQDVKAKLVSLGVNPEEAKQRLASLSDAEVQALYANVDQAPAGGDSSITISVGAAIIIVLLLVIFF